LTQSGARLPSSFFHVLETICQEFRKSKCCLAAFSNFYFQLKTLPNFSLFWTYFALPPPMLWVLSLFQMATTSTLFKLVYVAAPLHI